MAAGEQPDFAAGRAQRQPSGQLVRRHGMVGLTAEHQQRTAERRPWLPAVGREDSVSAWARRSVRTA